MATLKIKDDNAVFEIPSLQEQYADVLNAIQQIVNLSQSYSIVGGRTFTFASLDQLQKMKVDLKAEIDAEYGDTGVYHGDTGGTYNDDEAHS